MPYEDLLENLQRVDFDSNNPWLNWQQKDCAAIKAMFDVNTTVAATGEEDEDDDGTYTNRQSNVEGGRELFVKSQSSKNPYAGCRITAENGTHVPVISVDILRDNFCARIEDLLQRVRTCLPASPAGLPPAAAGVTPLVDLWRMAPHQNWSGSLPERQISAGESTWFKGQRGVHAYAMNEWQVSVRGNAVYMFDNKLATDPGAIRIVSVTGRRSLASAGFDYSTHNPLQPPGEGYKGLVEGKALDGRKFSPDGDHYDGSRGLMKIDNKSHGVPNTVTRKKPRKIDFTMRLHDRRPVRFYFSFNHYRPIDFLVKGEHITINPWFAIVG